MRHWGRFCCLVSGLGYADYGHLVSFVGALVVIKPGFAEFNLGILAILATAPLFAFSDLTPRN